MNKDEYRYTDTLFKRSQLVSPETGEGFAAKVRAVVADHTRQLLGTLARAKREGGRFTQGASGYKQTRLPGGIIVKTWINQFGLLPTVIARVTIPGHKFEFEFESDINLVMQHGWATLTLVAVTPAIAEYYQSQGSRLYLLSDPEEYYEEDAHFVGKCLSSTEFKCSETTYLPSFPDSPPTISGEGTHKALYGVYGDEFSNIELDYRFSYTGTGFIRHFAQSLAGRGRGSDIRRFINLMGTPWPSKTLYTYGLTIHEHEGNWHFWFTHFRTPYYLDLTPLMLPESAACLEAIIRENYETKKYTDLELQLLFAYLLASLEPTLVETVVNGEIEMLPEMYTLDLPGKLVEIYTNGGHPTAHSWHWDGFFLKDVERSSKAAVVLRTNESEYYQEHRVGCIETQLVEIEVKWGQDGKPINIIETVGNARRVRLDYKSFHSLYHIAAGARFWSDLYSGDTDAEIWEWSTLFTERAPIYCYWELTGDLKTIYYEPIKYDQDEARVFDPSFTNAEPGACNLNAADESRYQSVGGSAAAALVSGGFDSLDTTEQRYGYFIQYRRAWETAGLNDWTTYNLYDYNNNAASIAEAIQNILDIYGCGGSDAANWVAEYNDWDGAYLVIVYVHPLQVAWVEETIDLDFYQIGKQYLLLPSDPTIVHSVQTSEKDYGLRVGFHRIGAPNMGVAREIRASIVKRIDGENVFIEGPSSELITQWSSNIWSSYYAFGVAECAPPADTVAETPPDEKTSDVVVSFPDDNQMFSYEGDRFECFHWQGGSYKECLLLAKESANLVKVFSAYPGTDFIGPDALVAAVTSWFPDIGWVGGI